MKMKVGDEIDYKGYSITHPIKKEYVTEVAHNSLEDAKEFIDTLLNHDLIVNVTPEEVDQ